MRLGSYPAKARENPLELTIHTHAFKYGILSAYNIIRSDSVGDKPVCLSRNARFSGNRGVQLCCLSRIGLLKSCKCSRGAFELSSKMERRAQDLCVIAHSIRHQHVISTSSASELAAMRRSRSRSGHVPTFGIRGYPTHRDGRVRPDMHVRMCAIGSSVELRRRSSVCSN